MLKKTRLLPAILLPLLLAGVTLPAQTSKAAAAAPKVDLKYSFGPNPARGCVQVAPDMAYDDARGYGFDLGSKVAVVDRGGRNALKSGYVTGQDGRPFFFSTKLAPGVYRVTVTLGDAKAASDTTVKSETRRLMLEGIQTKPGRFVTRTFLVHLRIPELPNGTMVRLKPREHEPILVVQWDKDTAVKFTELDWDNKLTLEFSGPHPALCSVQVATAGRHTTVYLIGDSTVTDQMMEPWSAWGQILPRWFRPPVVIANYAESGETAASFIGERRWAKLLTEIHPGDYVLMQFGINDLHAHIPLERFKGYFVRYIKDTRAHGATPVLVTSQNLRRLDANGKAVQTLDGYPEAMRGVAKEQHVALIDLNAMSMTLYEAIGPKELPKIFVDGTHQDDYGSYELAKCVVDGIVKDKLPFARYLVSDWKPFDPAHPDSMENFNLPPDPQLDPNRPGAKKASAPAAAPTETKSTAAPHP